MKFIVKGTPQEVELVLPDALKSFENVAAYQCVILVSSVQKEFVSVMNIAGELLVAWTQAKGIHEQELRKTNNCY